MLKTAKDVKDSIEFLNDNEEVGNFWEEVENLKMFEKKKEAFSYATNCMPYLTIGCC